LFLCLGLDNLRRDLVSWDWVYGKTPDFSVTRRFSVSASSSAVQQTPEITVTLRVSKGLVVDAEVSDLVNDPLRPIDITRIMALKGQKYADGLLAATVGTAFDSPVAAQPTTPNKEPSLPSSQPSGAATGGKGRSPLKYQPMGPREREYVTSILTCA
jgi:hypothetical protein